MPFKPDSASGGAATRATKLTSVSSFKLYAYNSSGTAIADGVTYTKSGSSWTTTSKVFWPQTGNVTFYAFSPASNSSVSFNTPSKTLTYTAPTGESSQQDVLYAYKTSARPSNNTVDLTFNHANAAFSVNARLATGCTATVNVSGVQLVNVKPTNTLTFTNGNATASGNNISSTLACSAKTLTTSNQAISSSPLIIPPQSVTAWNGTSALANTYLAVTCKVSENDTYVVGSASANGTVYVPMDKTLNKGEDNSVNLVFGSETDNGRSYGRDENGNRITVPNYNWDGKAVDLGLSVLWADKDFDVHGDNGNSNIVIQDYFNWAESAVFDDDKAEYRYEDIDGDGHASDNGGADSYYFNYNWEHTPYYIGDSNGNNRDNASSWSKYTTSAQTLDLSDDIIHVFLGGKWRMPTEAEWQELINNCNWQYDAGAERYDCEYASYKVSGKKEGYTNNNISFIGGDGYIDGLTLKYYCDWTADEVNDEPWNYEYSVNNGIFYYWSSTMGDVPSQARGIKCDISKAETFSISNYDRRLGFKIRPVCDK